MDDPQPFDTGQWYAAFMASCTGPRKRHRRIKGSAFIDQHEFSFVEFQPKQGFVGFRWSPSNLFSVRDVPSKSAGFIRSFHRSRDVVHVGLDGFLVPAKSCVGLDVPRPNAEHAHQEDAQQEGEDVAQFSGRRPGVVNETLLLQTNTSRVVTSNEANCKVNSITSPLVCQTASDVPYVGSGTQPT